MSQPGSHRARRHHRPPPHTGSNGTCIWICSHSRQPGWVLQVHCGQKVSCTVFSEGHLTSQSSQDISSQPNDLPGGWHCGGELLCCRDACEAREASDDVGVTRTCTLGQQSHYCERDQPYPTTLTNNHLSLPTPNELARSHHHPASRCQLWLSRGRPVMMRMKRERCNRLERVLGTCPCNVVVSQCTVDVAKEKHTTVRFNQWEKVFITCPYNTIWYVSQDRWSATGVPLSNT